MPHPKRVLITGAAGFIGSQLVRHALQQGCGVVSVDDLSLFSARPELGDIGYSECVGTDSLESWLGSTPPRFDVIFHLGACTDTTEMDRNLLDRLNFQFSKMLWQYSAKNQIGLVYASSAATYGDGTSGYSDNEASIPTLQPLNPYGDSKQKFDCWALSQTAGASPRFWSGFKFFNVYGFGERHKGKMASVILHAFDQIHATGKVKLFRSHREGVADGEQKRDFVSVRDVIRVLWFAAQQPLARGIYNLGTGQARSYLDLANATFAALNRTPSIEFIDMPPELRGRYQYFTQAPMEKLRQAGYREPFLTLEAGVADYVQQLVKAKG